MTSPTLRASGAAWEKVIQRRLAKYLLVAQHRVDEPFVWYEDSYQDVVNRVHEVAPSVRCLEAIEAEYLGDPITSKLSLPSVVPAIRPGPSRRGRAASSTSAAIRSTLPEPFPGSVVAQGARSVLDPLPLRPRRLSSLGPNQFGGDPYTEEGISQGALGDRAWSIPARTG